MKDHSGMISRLLRTVSNRRAFLGAGALLPLAPLVAGAAEHSDTHPSLHRLSSHAGGMTTVGTVDHGRNGFDPHDLLTDWEQEFVESIERQYRSKGTLSPRQREVLEKIFRKQNEG